VGAGWMVMGLVSTLGGVSIFLSVFHCVLCSVESMQALVG